MSEDRRQAGAFLGLLRLTEIYHRAAIDLWVEA
jgi:hypothetical protein